MQEPNVQIYKKAGGTCACVPVCLSLQLWFRGNNNHDQEKKRKASKLASFTLEGKEQTMEQEKLNIDRVWCRRQINQVITELRWQVEQNGRLKKGGMEAVQ